MTKCVVVNNVEYSAAKEHKLYHAVREAENKAKWGDVVFHFHSPGGQKHDKIKSFYAGTEEKKKRLPQGNNLRSVNSVGTFIYNFKQHYSELSEVRR